MWRHGILVSACALAAITVSACGGVGTEGLFSSGDDDSDGSGNAGNENDGGAGNAGGTGNATTAGGAGNEGAVSPSGGAGNDGGDPPVGGSGNAGGSGGMPREAALDCGRMTCPQGGANACCWDEYELSAPPIAECVSGPPDNDGCNTGISNDGLETRIECQLPSHCSGGQVCCANREFFQSGGQNFTYYPEVSCANTCEWTDVTLCDPSLPVCGTELVQGVPTQLVCKQSELLPEGYFVCGTP